MYEPLLDNGLRGFALRGYWMLSGSPNLRVKFVRIALHVVDTVFLLSHPGNKGAQSPR